MTLFSRRNFGGIKRSLGGFRHRLQVKYHLAVQRLKPPRLPTGGVSSVKIFGYYRSTQSSSHLMRCLTAELLAHQVKVQLVCPVQVNWGQILPDLDLQEIETMSRPVKSEANLYFCMPTQVRPESGIWNANVTASEASRLPASWVAASRMVEQIIVPGQFCRQVWIESGVKADKVSVLRHGVNPLIFKPGTPPLSLRLPDGRPLESIRHRFLNLSETNLRKNPAGLLKTWLLATNTGDDAVLVLKPGFYSRDAREAFLGILQQVEKDTGKRFSQAAPLLVFEDVLTQHDIPRLYATATHYWSMSFGEGFDLCMMEAAACGLQLIAPAHSAYLDYLDSENAHLLPSRMVEAKPSHGLHFPDFFKGLSWWEPDQEAAGTLIRSIIDGTVPDKLYPQSKIVPQYTWSAVGDDLMKLLTRAA